MWNKRKPLAALCIVGLLVGLLAPSPAAAQQPSLRPADSCAAGAGARMAPFRAGDTVRILAVGNSFSEDAVEQYLYELAQAEGIELVVGNLYIGGCAIDRHLANARADAPAYEYRKIVEGRKTNRAGIRLSEALREEAWDFVSLQQASPASGQYDTYNNTLPPLVDYVKHTLRHAACRIVFHQTWAYAQDATHPGFAHYHRNQSTMYAAIVDAVGKAVALSGIETVIPAGAAIQHGRATPIGDRLTRDGYHLNDVGRYIAACTWLEALLGKNAVGNRWRPPTLTPEWAALAQEAAHAAVARPDTPPPAEQTP
ncbi:MAG: DUF4886 domain-containing protein [Prevotellaceae bacterium]|jgi:hypothetical protein|nr:DUF4886 domain-containing protein [Prevotellaceae bacterium]